jgi:hypothetical protein
MLMAIAFGCALMIGVNAASSGTAARAVPAPAQGATSTDEHEVDDASQVSPACVQASECTAFCAGGIPLCVAKHCTCAS